MGNCCDLFTAVDHLAGEEDLEGETPLEEGGQREEVNTSTHIHSLTVPQTKIKLFQFCLFYYYLLTKHDKGFLPFQRIMVK